jgi:hypothetical protein
VARRAGTRQAISATAARKSALASMRPRSGRLGRAMAWRSPGEFVSWASRTWWSAAAQPHPCSPTRRRSGDRRDIQSFELEIEDGGGTFVYRLEVQHSSDSSEAQTPQRPQIKSEYLHFDAKPLFRYTDGQVRLFSEDHSPGAQFPFKSEHSFLPNLESQNGNFGKEDGDGYSLPFTQLSEGHRILSMLYAIVYGLVGSASVLCFDEPENFISLPEVQPWLQCVRDLVEEREGQVLLISHHPEVIDYLAADSAFRFERPSGDLARVSEWIPDPSKIMKPSEILARRG